MLRVNDRTDTFLTSGDEPWVSNHEVHHSGIRTLPKGTVVFIEGDRPRGVYLIKRGRVKLTTSTPEGRVLMLGVAMAGDTLGLSAVVSNAAYEATAEVLEPTVLEFVPKEIYLARLRRNAELAIKAVSELSQRYRNAHLMMRSIANAVPVLTRLARLFLNWAAERPERGDAPVELRNRFTHQEIAEMIGSSRETVTRVLREMRERDLVTLKGAELRIHSLARLNVVAAGTIDQYCDSAHRPGLA